MIQIKNINEINKIRDSGFILTETFKELEKALVEGIKTKELDKLAYDFIIKSKAKPAFLGYMNYPASICISLNNEVIHGIPGERKIKNGDLVSLDIGVDLRGYFSDAAYTYCVGQVTAEQVKLVETTHECLERGVAQAVAGNRIHDISAAVFNYANKLGYGVVREFCGHGVGFAQHEDPQIPNYINSGPNPRLKPGMVLAIEPMINVGTWEVQVKSDGWTVVTRDGKDSAHFEYTVAILKDRTENLTPIKSYR
jgi:methionyl aminopeptidase